jgi:chemotaxis protein histidine kinase CheA
MLEANSLSTPLSDFASPMDLAEAQLQRELRSMFDVDTQTYLQTYTDLVQRLQPATWTAEIQELYRCVHTIKGGAVTVGADGILYVSTVLEDLLSDLRYLQVAPPLEDGQLTAMLLEAGELLTASLQVHAQGAAAQLAVQPSVDRISVLRAAIQQTYLPEASEQSQLFQEFAEQGFDLVVLELEMAIEQLPAQGPVPVATIKSAKQTLQQLLQIGQDLEFEAGWKKLLQLSRILFSGAESDFWQAQWPSYLKTLKASASKGGKFPESVALSAFVPEAVASAQETAAPAKPVLTETRSQPVEAAWAPAPEPAVIVPIVEVSSLEQPSPSTKVEEPKAIATEPLPKDLPLETVAQVQIPVPLERLDRSAQNLVETLLSARATQGTYRTLQSQLVQLVALAQESAEYITRLRQLQDEYALMSRAEDERLNPTSGPVLERYRQGYTVINRLLETSLRLSELGEEVATSSGQTSEHLQLLDRNILSLQHTVEESRLIPFKTLGFRIRGILRDLITRYGKPAQLVIRGENLELDAGTVQALEPALLHLIRNAYDHGLETPEERTALGKPAQGTIQLSLQRQGNLYRLDVQDDGRGIDAQSIQQIARAKSLPLQNTDTPANLLAVLCQSGFSSRSSVSEISGRGVGMDVVATQVAAVGGRLSLDTQLEQGSSFHLLVPVPHLLLRCVLVKAGDRTFAIPSEEVVTTELFSNLNATQQMDAQHRYSWLIRHQDASIPAVDLLAYWQPQNGLRSLSDTAIALRVRSQSVNTSGSPNETWLLADDLLEQVDLLTSPIPKPLNAPTGLMGFSMLADGRLIPVLEPSSLVEQIVAEPVAKPTTEPAAAVASSQPPLTAEPAPQSTTPVILVVDDAALVRRRIEASLTSYGYTVFTCSDGLEAWNWLQSHPTPNLMISDIEMPGMDGFTLIDRCRQADINIPVLVVSSRLSEEWGKEARRLGATDYLTKGFTTPELLSKVRAYLTESR